MCLVGELKMDEIKTLKIIGLVALYIIYLMLSFILSGELAYRFAREQMGFTAYLLLCLFVVFGTTILIRGLLKLSKTT